MAAERYRVEVVRNSPAIGLHKYLVMEDANRCDPSGPRGRNEGGDDVSDVLLAVELILVVAFLALAALESSPWFVLSAGCFGLAAVSNLSARGSA